MQYFDKTIMVQVFFFFFFSVMAVVGMRQVYTFNVDSEVPSPLTVAEVQFLIVFLCFSATQDQLQFEGETVLYTCAT